MSEIPLLRPLNEYLKKKQGIKISCPKSHIYLAANSKVCDIKTHALNTLPIEGHRSVAVRAEKKIPERPEGVPLSSPVLSRCE